MPMGDRGMPMGERGMGGPPMLDNVSQGVSRPMGGNLTGGLDDRYVSRSRGTTQLNQPESAVFSAGSPGLEGLAGLLTCCQACVS